MAGNPGLTAVGQSLRCPTVKRVSVSLPQVTSPCRWLVLFLYVLMTSTSPTGQTAGATPSDTLARANTLHTQASNLEAEGRWREALPLREQFASLIEAGLGKEHADTDTARWDLANTLLLPVKQPARVKFSNSAWKHGCGSWPDCLGWRGFADLLSLLGTPSAREPEPLAMAVLRLKGTWLD